ncbi:hypothetical protein B0H34DRAFT_828266 [Crassisporium funariophilum]|nr:hypothetical protein B0H34DRAFT_828266 [Crassisporium funariophilum]
MVVRDVKTRWNYTHAMIRRGLQLKESVDTWVFNTPALRGISLTPNDWKLLAEIADFLEVCKLFVACGIAWNTANNPEMQKFTKKWCHSNVKMSDRRVLSGRVLDGEVKKIEKTVKDAVAGLLVTGQCDGWKNVAKDHVVSTVMTAGNEVRGYSAVLTKHSPYHVI